MGIEKQIQKMEEQQCEYNKIKKTTNVLFNLILTILSLLSVIPFIFVIIIFKKTLRVLLKILRFNFYKPSRKCVFVY